MGNKTIGHNARLAIAGLDIGFKQFQIDYEGIEYEKDFKIVEMPDVVSFSFVGTYRGSLFFRTYRIEDQFKNPLCIMLDVILGG